MKATAIYIPELGETFFIEEIVSISDIQLYGNHTVDTYQFFIGFKNGLLREINTVRNLNTGFINIQKREWLESIRNQFLQHTNIINAQETDKERLTIKITKILENYDLEMIQTDHIQSEIAKEIVELMIQSELHIT